MSTSQDIVQATFMSLLVAANGSVTNRAVWTDDRIWWAGVVFGVPKVYAWLCEVARPDARPFAPGFSGDTFWRLHADEVRA